MDVFLQLNALLIVLGAALLGGAVGYERLRAHKAAGLRTHMLVSAVSALLVLLGEFFIRIYEASSVVSIVEADPIRILQSIIIGISFIGGGVIFKSGKGEDGIQNLTTAASVLFAAAIGITVALEAFYLAVALAIFVVSVNYLILKFEHATHLKE